MHVLVGYLFVLLSIFLFLAYLVVPCLLLPLLQRIVAFFKQKGYADCWSFLWFLLPEKRKATIGVALMVALFIFSIYSYQRFIWMGKDNANYIAKEYFVAGQPLCGVRWVLCTYLNPENPFVVPLNALQKLIYNQGVKYLPGDDGEIGIWEDLWFNYPYIKRMHDPYGTDKFHPSPNMRLLLDRIYTDIEIMATKSFADQQMEREYALRNLPRAAFYYSLNSGYYADKMVGSYGPLLQRKEYVRKTENLYRWTTVLRQRWIDEGIYEQIKIQTPKIELTRQLLLIHFGGNLLYASIYTGDFSCKHPLIPAYLAARRDFTDPKSPDYVWGRLHARQKQQAELLYRMAIDTESVSFTKYILEHYCSLPVPGEERFYGRKDKVFSRKTLIPGLKRYFHKEIKLIEEEINEQ